MVTPDLLGPGPIRFIRLDLTTRCNLRCTYCAVSQPFYAGVDMAPQLMDRLLAAVPKIGRDPQIAVNGHGETTYLKDWHIFCQKLIAQGARLNIITNLAKVYEQAEIETLAGMEIVQVSLDTLDDELLQNVRRRVNARRILGNLRAIKAAAARLGRRDRPVLSISCGLYDRNTPLLLDLVRGLMEFDVQNFTFWNLVKYPDLPDAVNVQPLDHLPIPEIESRLRVVDEALELLRKRNIQVHIAGDFIAPLRRLVADARIKHDA